MQFRKIFLINTNCVTVYTFIKRFLHIAINKRVSNVFKRRNKNNGVRMIKLNLENLIYSWIFEIKEPIYNYGLIWCTIFYIFFFQQFIKHIKRRCKKLKPLWNPHCSNTREICLKLANELSFLGLVVFLLHGKRRGFCFLMVCIIISLPWLLY